MQCKASLSRIIKSPDERKGGYIVLFMTGAELCLQLELGIKPNHFKFNKSRAQPTNEIRFLIQTSVSFKKSHVKSL